MNKPRKQTLILPQHTPAVLAPLPLKKLRSLGGAFGKEVMEALDLDTIGDIVKLDKAAVRASLGERAEGVLALCSGRCSEPVQERVAPNSIGASRRFAGKLALRTKPEVLSRLTTLVSDLVARCEEDGGRVPTHMVVGCEADPGGKVSRSFCESAAILVVFRQFSHDCLLHFGIFQVTKTGAIPRSGIDAIEPIVMSAWKTLEPWLRQHGNSVKVTFLSVTCSAFQDKSSQITNFFKAGGASASASASAVGKPQPDVRKGGALRPVSPVRNVKQEKVDIVQLSLSPGKQDAPVKIYREQDDTDSSPACGSNEAPSVPEPQPQPQPKVVSLLAPLRSSADLRPAASAASSSARPKGKGKAKQQTRGPLDAFVSKAAAARPLEPIDPKTAVPVRIAPQPPREKASRKRKAPDGDRGGGQSSLKNWIKPVNL